MRYIKYFLIFVSLLCTNILGVKALSCSNSVTKDLGQIASYVKASYEVIDNSQVKDLVVGEDKTTYTIPNYNFEISIYNITDDIYAKVKEDVTKKEFTVYSSDTNDGVYTFSNDDFGVIHTYTIEVMSAKDECYGEKVRTITLVQPMYNAYSEYTYCKTSSNLLCQKFVTKDLGLTSVDDFMKRIKVNNESNAPVEEDDTEDKSIIDMLREHWVFYTAIFVTVILATITAIIIIKKRNGKNKGWRL